VDTLVWAGSVVGKMMNLDRTDLYPNFMVVEFLLAVVSDLRIFQLVHSMEDVE
jgi:hypothetical protein